MQGSVLLIFFNVTCFHTVQPFSRYTTAAAFNTKMSAHQTEADLYWKESEKPGRRFCRLLHTDHFLTAIHRCILFHLPRWGSFKPQIKQSEQGAIFSQNNCENVKLCDGKKLSFVPLWNDCLQLRTGPTQRHVLIIGPESGIQVYLFPWQIRKHISLSGGRPCAKPEFNRLKQEYIEREVHLFKHRTLETTLEMMKSECLSRSTPSSPCLFEMFSHFAPPGCLYASPSAVRAALLEGKLCGTPLCIMRRAHQDHTENRFCCCWSQRGNTEPHGPSSPPCFCLQSSFRLF